jgi:hypothetical protein
MKSGYSQRKVIRGLLRIVIGSTFIVVENLLNHVTKSGKDVASKFTASVGWTGWSRAGLVPGLLAW